MTKLSFIFIILFSGCTSPSLTIDESIHITINGESVSETTSKALSTTSIKRDKK